MSCDVSSECKECKKNLALLYEVLRQIDLLLLSYRGDATPHIDKIVKILEQTSCPCTEGDVLQLEGILREISKTQ